MVKRTQCLYKDTIIGIETIYTVINGKQINIPDKLNDLRMKSRNNELFCPCGCGANLILVAGEHNLREQHFRIKDKDDEKTLDCRYIAEGETSINSKVILKCWLDDKLKAQDIDSRVQISDVDDTNRKYEFTFLSLSRKVTYFRKVPADLYFISFSIVSLMALLINPVTDSPIFSAWFLIRSLDPFGSLISIRS